jgi:hypothetical protein
MKIHRAIIVPGVCFKSATRKFFSKSYQVDVKFIQPCSSSLVVS